MKRVLFFALLLLFLGVFVKFGKKNFPSDNSVAVEAFSGEVFSLNPYNLPTSECIELKTSEGMIIRPVVSFRDFSVFDRKIEVSDKVILYAWDNKLYPATSKIDWVLFNQRVDEEATRVCIVFVVLALFVAIWGPKLVL